MAYSTSAPPAKIAGTIGGNSLWIYSSADADSTVTGASYFTNGFALGMKVGDPVIVVDTATPKTSVVYASSVTTSSAVTVAFAAVA